MIFYDTTTLYFESDAEDGTLVQTLDALERHHPGIASRWWPMPARQYLMISRENRQALKYWGLHTV